MSIAAAKEPYLVPLPPSPSPLVPNPPLPTLESVSHERSEEEDDLEKRFPTALVTRTTPEVQLQLDTFNAVELVQHLSEVNKNSDHALTLVFEPPGAANACSGAHHSTEGSVDASEIIDGYAHSVDSEKASVCLPVAVHTAYTAFGIFRKMMQEGGWSERIGERAERFLERFLKLDVLETCFQVADEWAQVPTVESLLKLEPFAATDFERAHFKDPILLGRHVFSKEGILTIVNRMWDEAIHIQMVGGILTYQGEIILCLRIQVNPALYAYLILDCHRRPSFDRDLPAFVLIKSRDVVTSYVYDLWKAKPAQGSETLLVTALLLQHGRVSLPIEDDIEFLSEVVGDAATSATQEPSKPDPRPASEGPSSRIVTQTEDPPQISPETEASKLSKQRVQSEFGWQLGLQSHSMVLPFSAPSREGVKPKNPDRDVLKDQKPSPSSAAQDPGVPSSSAGQPALVSDEAPKPPTKPRSRADLSKKDIGWQLALQEQVGAIILPSQSELQSRGDSATSLPSTSRGGGLGEGSSSKTDVVHGASATSLSQKSVASKRSGKQPEPPAHLATASSSRTKVEHMQKRFQRDIRWQAPLSAKTMTFPLPKTEASTPLSRSAPSSSTQLANTLGVLNPSPLATTEFGTLQEGTSLANLTTKHDGQNERTPSPEVQEECEYCFGIVAHRWELITVGLESRHCRHKICKTCLRRHFLEELEKRHYPVVCPACTLTGRLRATVLGMNILERLEFSGIELAQYEKLKFQKEPIAVFCPKCKASPLRQRDRSARTLPKLLKCSHCEYNYCRECHADVEDTLHSDHAPHHCETATITKLLRKQRGRRCPGCNYLVKRKRGQSNHLQCHEKCGMHFCFRCGEVVADTAMGRDAERGAHNHYLTCVLVEQGHDKSCVIQ